MDPLEKFYIQSFESQYQLWNRGYPNTIIQAEDDVENPYRTNDLYKLKVIAPVSFATIWPFVSERAFIECPGPARHLTPEEYVELMQKLTPNLSNRDKPKSTEVFQKIIESKNKADAC